MEPASPAAGGPEEGVPGVIAGVGNPLCGDDGIGPAVARRVHELLADREDWDLVELCCSAMDLVERLSGYRRAVVIDALADWDAPVGSVFRVRLSGNEAELGAPSHAFGLAGALVLARAAGLPLPDPLFLYGVVVKRPLVFGDGLSECLRARLDEIARAIVTDISGSAGEEKQALVRPA